MGRPAVQPKLELGAANDPAEREADAVADQVMAMPAPELAGPPVSPAAGPSIQRACAACEEERVQRQAEEEEEEVLQPKVLPGRPGVVAASAEGTVRGLRGGGQPLPAAERAFFEPRFEHSFADVRIHTDGRADNANRMLAARAFTVGNDIAFKSGEYRPASVEGRRLIAHELTHVVQQGFAPPRSAGAPRPVARAPPMLQRACRPDEIGTVTGCDERSGDIFGTPILFNAGCDTLTPDGEDLLKEMGEDLRGQEVNVHGFASEEGDKDFNDSLSCLRAYIVAIRLTKEFDVYLNQAYAYGPTPGSREERRSVCLEPLGPHEPEPVPVPEPIRVPATETEEDGGCEWFSCGPIENVFAQFLLNGVECLCELVKFIDMVEDILAIVPTPVAPFFANPLVQETISGVDAACGLFDLFELLVNAGCSGEGCWSVSEIDAVEAGRLAVLAAVLYADFRSNGSLVGAVAEGLSVVVQFIISIVETILVGGGFATADLPAALFSFLASEAFKGIIKLVMKLFLEFLADLLTYLVQNQITHGTPFPVDSCRACAGLINLVGLPDLTGTCNDIAAALTWDPLHWTDWDPDFPMTD